MKFTIAVPTYNNEKTILETVNSCLNQDYDNEYEVLVLNNASNDRTATLIEGLNNTKVKIITNPETVSMYENHNECLKNAIGEYILFCHSDDQLDTSALKTLDRELSQIGNSDRVVVWGRSLFRDYYKNWKRAGGELGKPLSGDSCIVPSLYWGLTPSGTCFSRRMTLESGGFYDMKARLAPSDIITMIRLGLNEFNFLMLDEKIFTRKDASTAHSGISKDENLEAVVEAYSTLFKSLDKIKISKIINTSKKMWDIPTVFFHAMLKLNFLNRSFIWKKILKTLITRPYMVLNPNFRHLIRDLLLFRN